MSPAIRYAAANWALLKASVPPELVALVRAEVDLRTKLVALHWEAALDAIKAAMQAAQGHNDPEQAATLATEAAAKAYASTLVQPVQEALTAAMPEFYRLAKVAAAKKAAGVLGDASLQTELPANQRNAPVPIVKLTFVSTLEHASAFTTEDADAVAKLTEHQVFWVGKHAGTAVSDRIAQVARDEIVKKGLGSAAAGRAMATGLVKEFGLDPELAKLLGLDPPSVADVPIPAGFKGGDREYFRMIASNAATTGRVFGSVAAFERMGVQHCEIVNPIDERTCSRCSLMDGYKWDVKDVVAQRDAVLAAKTPDDVRAAQPWHGKADFAAIHASGAGGMASHGVTLPPYHGGCRCTVDVTADAAIAAPPPKPVPAAPPASPLAAPTSPATPAPTATPPAPAYPPVGGQIASMAELDAMPIGSEIKLASGSVYHKLADGWHYHAKTQGALASNAASTQSMTVMVNTKPVVLIEGTGTSTVPVYKPPPVAPTPTPAPAPVLSPPVVAAPAPKPTSPVSSLATPPPAPKNVPAWKQPFKWSESDLKDVGRQGLGGAHAKTVLTSPDGTRWLFKPVSASEEFRAAGEKVGSDLALALDMPAAEMHVITFRGQLGTAQRMFPNVVGDFESYHGSAGYKQLLSELSHDDWDYIHRESALNYLIGDNDGHTGNFLRLGDGSITGIDKGQLFKFFDKDVLDWNYHPNNGFHAGAFDRQLLKHYADGANPTAAMPSADKLKRLQAMFDKLDAMPDADFVDILRPYAEKAHAKRLGVLGKWTPSEFYDAVLERKKALRKEWTHFMQRAEDARNKALGRTVPAKKPRAPAKPKVLTLVDKKFLKDVVASKAQGRSFAVAGHHVEDGHVLVYGTSNDGTWLECKLRGAADSAFEKLALNAPGAKKAVVAAPSPVAAAAADAHYNDILAVIKSYNHHLAPGSTGMDGVVPAGKCQLFKDQWNKLALKYMNATSADEKAQAFHYLGEMSKYIENPPLFNEIMTNTIAPDPASASSGNYKWKVGADAPFFNKGHKFEKHVPAPAKPVAPVPAPPLAAPSVAGPKVQIHNHYGLPRSFKDGEISIDGTVPNQWINVQTIEVDLGDGDRAFYVTHSSQAQDFGTQTGKTQWSKAGKLQLQLADPAKDVTPERISQAWAKLDKVLGLPSTATMTSADVEVLYLRKCAHASGYMDTAAFKAIPETEDAATQLPKLLKAWQAKVGTDPRTMPGYNPQPNWDGGAPGAGLPRWVRFDLSESERRKLLDEYVLVHELYGASGGKAKAVADMLDSVGGLASSEERVRLGVTKAGGGIQGMSSGPDMSTGGADYVFTRIKHKASSEALRRDFVFRADVVLDPGTVVRERDTYGASRPSYFATHTKGRTAAGIEGVAGEYGNEIMPKARLHFSQLRYINCTSQMERQQVIAEFRKRGINELGGVPVDQVVRIP